MKLGSLNISDFGASIKKIYTKIKKCILFIRFIKLQFKLRVGLLHSLSQYFCAKYVVLFLLNQLLLQSSNQAPGHVADFISSAIITTTIHIQTLSSTQLR